MDTIPQHCLTRAVLVLLLPTEKHVVRIVMPKHSGKEIMQVSIFFPRHVTSARERES